MQRCVAISILLALAHATGCQPAADPAQSAWQVIAAADMTPQQTAQRDQALAAREAMFTQLSGQLMEVMGAQGPAAAIAVCSEAAPRIAAEVAQHYRVSIGRTSYRLRNPQNTPPAWAAQLVRNRAEQPTFLTDGRQLAALLPIRLQATCLMCHGPEEDIPPAVKKSLAERYPRDQATGFREDMLRGWFWVEVPAVGDSASDT